MHKVHLSYRLAAEAPDGEPLHHPLFALLAAIHADGSISGAARRLGLSYRHVWGELSAGRPSSAARWCSGSRASPRCSRLRREAAVGRAARAGPARTADRGPARRARARLRRRLRRQRLGAHRCTRAMTMALPRAARSAARTHGCISTCSSPAASTRSPRSTPAAARWPASTPSPTRRCARRPRASSGPLLRPGLHKLHGFRAAHAGPDRAGRQPARHRVAGRADAQRRALCNRAMGTGTRVLLDELLSRAGIDAASIEGYASGEPSHAAAAAVVASGRPTSPSASSRRRARRGLDFIALAEEHYFLVCLKSALEQAAAAGAARGAGQRRMGATRSARCPATRRAMPARCCR